MKLLTNEIVKKFASVGSQDGLGREAIVIAKFFGGGACTWLATEYDPEEEMFFGYVNLGDDMCAEWGRFSLEMLEELRFKPFGLGVERDMHCGYKEIHEHYAFVQ